MKSTKKSLFYKGFFFFYVLTTSFTTSLSSPPGSRLPASKISLILSAPLPQKSITGNLRASYRQVKFPRFYRLLLPQSALPANPRQVTGKLDFPGFISFSNRKTPFRQVTGKLSYAHIGMYFIYLGAVSGSNGRISFFSTASLIIRETIPDDETFNPKRCLRDVFVRYSPFRYLIQACK